MQDTAMGHLPQGFNVGGVTRAADEEHRVATPLELLFDLCFVVAVAQASSALYELLVERHFADAIVGFLAVFFGIWWAWVNVVWFTTCHDSDDVVHRLLTLIQMAGALILAAGVHNAMIDLDFRTITAGYAVMRLGLVPLWIRVGRDQPDHRARACRYAGTIVGLQVLWIARLAVVDSWRVAVATFVAGVVLELVAPIWAERRATGQQFNGDHLAERFGLFTIIVLGEVLLSATFAVEEAIEADGVSVDLLVVAGSGLIVAFAIWWAYFGRNDVPVIDRLNGAFLWGYGHLPVFGGLAAFGAGIHVAIAAVVGHGDHVPTDRLASLAVTVPLAVAVAGHCWVVWSSGSDDERTTVPVLLTGAAALVVLGLAAPPKVALTAAAGLFVAGATAQGVLVRKSMPTLRA
jgi:low temperature requirement protein LtrA